MKPSRLLGLVLLAALVGCRGGDGDLDSATTPELTPRDAIAKSLNQMLESGAPGSEIGGVMEGIEALRESEPAIAEALDADADELMRLMSLEDSAGMKAKIDEMLIKLEGTVGK